MARATDTRKSPQGARPEEPAPDTADGAGNPSEFAVGLAVVPLWQRKFQPQPARFVVGAAFDAEGARGEPGDLIVLAVDPDALQLVLATLRDTFADVRTVAETG